MPVLSDENLKLQLEERRQKALDDIVSSVKTAKCNLFLGSGVHAPPPATVTGCSVSANDLPPIGAGLSRQLAKSFGYDLRFPGEDITNLPRVSQFVESEAGRARLIDEINAAVAKDKKPSPVLHALAELNFPVVITTNYDSLFEQALAMRGKMPAPTLSVYEANENGPPRPTVDTTDLPAADAPFVFKMHGDIRQRRSIVITEEDYIQFILRSRDEAPYHSIPKAVQEAVNRAPTLFIGYSLRDYNLRVWLKMLHRMVDAASFRDIYSVDFRPDPIIFDVWSSQRRYVNFIASDVWDFVPKLYQAVTGKAMPV